ncbi:MAG TPA: hypothetical protein PLD02_13555, partial [Saprospiraceae bacterium]|nr:hypothetical protein [Saprospiraceae bacterium]
TSTGGGGGSYQAPTMTNLVDGGLNINAGYFIMTRLCGITLNSSSNPICAGTSVTLTTDAISNYSWSTGAAVSSIVVTPTANTVFSIVATSSANCVASAAITISVAASVPNLTLTNNTPSLCPGQSATLTASGATTYAWSGGVTNGLSFIPAITQVYTVTGTNPCGSTNATTSIFMNPTPTVTATASTPSLCSGSSATLIGGGAVNYTWSPFVVNGAGFFPNATVTYTVVGAAANGCTNSAVATISVVTTPVTPPSVAPALICNNGSTATLTSTGATNYTWMPGSFSTAVIVVNPTTTTVYTITRKEPF